MENKIYKLADILVNYSLKVKSGERVLIIVESLNAKNLVNHLIDLIYKNNGLVSVKLLDNEIISKIYENLSERGIEQIIKQKWFEVDNYDAFITIRYTENDYGSKNINKKMKNLLDIRSVYLDDIRINKRKWVLLNYPSSLDANKAHMTTNEFSSFAFDVMTIDYEKMYNELLPLKKIMEATDKVRIVGKDTDISFSIKGIPAVICAGESNIPDGEIFTAPIKDSVNGYITYNTPSPYKGNVFNNIKLTFENGKIIDFACDNEVDKLKEIFDTDDGARYIGEFSLGTNPLIMYPMGDILYDEKIFGSIHFTPGRAYQDAFNGNVSSIHWDLVRIGRSDYGSDEIYFDDKLIRKNGLFVLKELEGLNYNKKDMD